MRPEVISLVPDAPATIDQSLIKKLEELLDLARAGKINCLAYVGCKSLGVGNARRWWRGWAGSGVSYNFPAIHGEFMMLQWEMCAVRAQEDHPGDSPEIAE